MAVHGARRISGKRSLTTAALATASLLLAGCTAATSAISAPSSNAAPSSSMSVGASPTSTDASPVSVPIDGPPVIPDLVAPPLESLWYPFTDKHTHVRFHLPHTPIHHTVRAKSCFGQQEVVWFYEDIYQLAPGHVDVDIEVAPFTVAGTLHVLVRSNAISCTEQQMKSAGYRHVTVSEIRTKQVQGYQALSWAFSGQSSKTGYWTYNRAVLIHGPTWGLEVSTGVTVSKSGVTAAERRDTTRVLSYVLQGLDLRKAG